MLTNQFVASGAVFLEKSVLSKRQSGRNFELSRSSGATNGNLIRDFERIVENMSPMVPTLIYKQVTLNCDLQCSYMDDSNSYPK